MQSPSLDESCQRDPILPGDPKPEASTFRCARALNWLRDRDKGRPKSGEIGEVESRLLRGVSFTDLLSELPSERTPTERRRSGEISDAEGRLTENISETDLLSERVADSVSSRSGAIFEFNSSSNQSVGRNTTSFQTTHAPSHTPCERKPYRRLKYYANQADVEKSADCQAKDVAKCSQFVEAPEEMVVVSEASSSLRSLKTSGTLFMSESFHSQESVACPLSESLDVPAPFMSEGFQSHEPLMRPSFDVQLPSNKRAPSLKRLKKLSKSHLPASSFVPTQGRSASSSQGTMLDEHAQIAAKHVSQRFVTSASSANATYSKTADIEHARATLIDGKLPKIEDKAAAHIAVQGGYPQLDSNRNLMIGKRMDSFSTRQARRVLQTNTGSSLAGMDDRHVSETPAMLKMPRPAVLKEQSLKQSTQDTSSASSTLQD